jgi:hypothetical protein
MSKPNSTRPTGRDFARYCLLMSVVGGLPATVLAAPQDLSFQLRAAAPGSYDAQVGGGLFGAGSSSQVAGALDGADFVCGDRVTHFLAVGVAGNAADARQEAVVELRASASSSGVPGAAYTGLKELRVLRGEGSGTADDWGTNPAALDGYFVDSVTGVAVGGPGPGVEFRTHVKVDDLEPGEQVILAFDAELACRPGVAATGNLTVGANFAKVFGAGEGTVNIGQSVVLSRVEDAEGTGTPAARVQKTVTRPEMVCPGREQEPIYRDAQVKYCYAVRNPGTESLYNIVVTDDNGTPNDPNDDLLDVALTGLEDLDADGVADDLRSNRSASGFAVGIASFRDNNAFPFSTATIRGTDSAGNSYASADGATVQIQIKPSALQLKVTASNDEICGNGDDATTIYAGVGQAAWFCYTVTNTSSLEIFGVNIPGVSGSLASLLPGQTGVISEMVQVGEHFTPTGMVTATGIASDNLAVESNGAAAGIMPMAAELTMNMAVSTDNVCGNEDDSTSATVVDGTPIRWCYTVTNIGSFDVTGVHIVDAEATVSTVEDLPTGTSATFMSEEMIASGLFSNTAHAAGEFIFGNVVSNTTGAVVDTVAPELEVVKTASRSGDCADGSAVVSALSNDLITWCYTVNNLGDTDLTDVVVTDGATILELGDILVGGSASDSSSSRILVDTVTGMAKATATDSVTGAPVDDFSDTASVDIIAPALSMALTVSDDGTCPGWDVVNVLSNDVVTWCYEVTNTGDVDLADLEVDSSTGYYEGIPALAVGETYSIPVDDVAAADLLVTAGAIGYDDVLGTLVEAASDSANVNVVSPSINVDVTISKDGLCPGVDDDVVAVGAAAQLCYAVSNDGDTSIYNASVVDEFLGNIGTITELAPGATQTFTTGIFIVTNSSFLLMPGYEPVTATASNMVNVTGEDAWGHSVADDDATIFKAISSDISVDLAATATKVTTTSGGTLTTTSTRVDATLKVTNIGQGAGANTVATIAVPTTLSYVSSAGAPCTWSATNRILTCNLTTLDVNELNTITAVFTGGAPLASSELVGFANSSTNDVNPANNRDTETVFTTVTTPTVAGSGATRTIGFYSTHPTFVASCLAAGGGSMNLGFVNIRNEVYDNEIDAVAGGSCTGGDRDRDIETAQEMAMGMLKGGVSKYADGSARSSLSQARMQAGQQMVAAICNNRMFGTPLPFTLSSAQATLAGTDRAAILALGAKADAYNNSGDSVALTVDTGKANAKAAYDDPTDCGD